MGGRFLGKGQGAAAASWGAPTTGWGAVQGCASSEGEVLDVRLRGNVVPLCKKDMG